MSYEFHQVVYLLRRIAAALVLLLKKQNNNKNRKTILQKRIFWNISAPIAEFMSFY